MSQETEHQPDVPFGGNEPQAIACIVWGGPQEARSAVGSARHTPSVPSPEQLRQWVSTLLTSDHVQVAQITLDQHTLQLLLEALLTRSEQASLPQQDHRQAASFTGFSQGSAAHRGLPQVTMTTFGRFTLCYEGREVAPPPRQGEMLCKLLLCQPNREAPCSWLAEKLWPQADGDQAMQYLYNSVTALRATLAADVLLTHRQTQSYQFVGQDRVWVDADAALDLLSQAQAVGRTTAEALPLLEQAVNYFRRGRYLAGIEETWVYARRTFLETGKERALLWLVEAYRQQERHEQAEALLTEALAQDPLNENLLHLLMQVLHEQGMTHQALRTYEEFARALRKADQEPAQATTALYARLRRSPRVLAVPVLTPIVPVCLPALPDPFPQTTGPDERN